MFKLSEVVFVHRVQASDKDWFRLQGKFLINGNPSRVVIFLEGPPAGVDILVDGFVVEHAGRVPPLPPPDFDVSRMINLFLMNTQLRKIWINYSV